MNCPKCGTDNPDYFVYCKRCSALLPSDEPTAQQRVAARVDAFSSYDPYTGVNAERLLNEPYYDPRQRHNAIDPWQLLDEGEQAAQSGDFSDRLDEMLPPEREYRRRSQRVPLNPDVVVTHSPQPSRSQSGRPVVKGRTATIGREETPVSREPEYAHARKTERQMDAPGETRRIPTPQRAIEPVPSTPLNAMQHAEEPADASPLSPRGGGERPANRLPEQPQTKRNAEAVLDDIFDEDDEPYEERRPKKVKPERVKKPKKADPLPLDVEDEDDEPPRSRSGMVFWVVIALLAAALLFVSFKIVTQNYGSVGGAFSAWFGGGDEGGAQQNGDASVLIEATSHAGLAAHSITVYGTDGHTVVFADPTTGQELKQAVLQNGGYKLTIVDLNWIPEDAGALTTFEVKPVVYLLDLEGTRTDLDVPAFTVNVPPTTVAVSAPDITAPVTVESTATTLKIVGAVEAKTPTRLFWGETEFTSAIDSETGAFTIEAPLVSGQKDYVLKATLARHGDVSIPIALDAVVSELTVTIDPPLASIPEESYTVSGKTEPGSTVTVAGPISGEVTVNNDGTFSFTADLVSAGYGIAEFTVTAENGGRTGSAAISLLHPPEIDAYSRKAQVFEHRTVLRNPNDSKGKIFRLDGTVQSVEKLSEYHQVVLVHVEGDKPVTLDYFSNTDLTVGTTYRFFADANGNTEETESTPKMPRMNAWFAGRS